MFTAPLLTYSPISVLFTPARNPLFSSILTQFLTQTRPQARGWGGLHTPPPLFCLLTVAVPKPTCQRVFSRKKRAFLSKKKEPYMGREMYNLYCIACHGGNVASGGIVPDLRYRIDAIAPA